MQIAAIYARISSDPSGQQLGTKRQLEDCRTLAERKGWDVAGEYVDDDVSAYKASIRPAYRELLGAITDGAVDAVIVWHLDRLHRQPKELEEFFEVCDKAGLTNLASVTGDVDLSSDDGRFMARILGAVARKESDDKSRRIRRKALELAMSGKLAGGGTRPFGFDPDRVTIRASEAAVIREVAGRFLAGESIHSLCRDLNTRRIATPTGGTWKSQTLSRMLKSARISGQREHRGEIVAKAEWPAIIDKAQTSRIRVILSDPSRRTNRSARRYLLAGMLRCALCHATLVSRPRSDGQRRYVCAKGPNFSGCGKIAVVADPLEALLVEALIYRLDSPELAKALVSARPEAALDAQQREIETASSQLEELAAMYGQRQISASEWLAARTPIEARLALARAELARQTGTTVLNGFVDGSGALRERWVDLPLSRQRAILGAVLDHAVIAPGRVGLNRFDPERVDPRWTL
jgi:site-specific DNA recombinase